MTNPLVRKLAVAGRLTPDDRGALERLSLHTRQIAARQDITVEGDRPENVHLVLEGFACRYKVLREGERYIMALMVPGDFCDLHVAILGEMDHSIAALSPCTVVEIPRATILDLTENHPRIARALWWATLVDEAILRAWLVNIALREAPERLAHFFCELQVRLDIVGLVDERGYSLPLTQYDLADLVGVTAVHMNRTLKRMQADGLIVLKRRRLVIPDVARLRACCDFNPNYLHLARRDAGEDG